MTGFRVPGPSRTVCPDCSFDLPSPEALKGPSGLLLTYDHAVQHRVTSHRRLLQLGQAPTRSELEALVREYAALVEQLEVRDRRRRRDLDDAHDRADDLAADLRTAHTEITELQAQVPT